MEAAPKGAYSKMEHQFDASVEGIPEDADYMGSIQQAL